MEVYNVVNMTYNNILIPKMSIWYAFWSISREVISNGSERLSTTGWVSNPTFNYWSVVRMTPPLMMKSYVTVYKLWPITDRKILHKKGQNCHDYDREIRPQKKSKKVVLVATPPSFLCHGSYCCTIPVAARSFLSLYYSCRRGARLLVDVTIIIFPQVAESIVIGTGLDRRLDREN